MKELINYSAVPENSTYTLAFQDMNDQEEYLALTEDRRVKPVHIAEDQPSNLRSLSNRADYIIITHDEFFDGIQGLGDLRRSEGLRVEIVLIGDIYDEFSYGLTDPRAIKDFLSYAYHCWQQPSPSYVILVGDASYDYKGNIAGGNENYVPTHLFVSQSDYLETSTDDWFVCVAGEDMLPDMLIGRLPVQTADEVEVIVEKIVDYERNIPSGEWRQNIMLVADNPDMGGDFEAVCDGFADDYIVQAGFEATKIYVSNCQPGCRQEIIAGIDNGCTICNYVGHGTMDIWAEEVIFESPDITCLNNGGRLPLIVSYTCFNGFFHHAMDDYCMAEAFIRASDKGAIACWTQSGKGYTPSSKTIGGHLYDALLNDGNCILGSAICQAKIAYLSAIPDLWDQAVMLVLFGDPALEMGFPEKADLLPGVIGFYPLSPVACTRDTVRASIFNAGRAAASDVLIRFTNGAPDSSSSVVIADVNLPYLQAGGCIDVSAVWDSVPDAGSYRIYVEVDPENQILESCEWNNVLWDTMHIRTPGEVQDTMPPIVELYVDGKRTGADFKNNDYASSTPEIEAVFRDCWSGINTENILLELNGEPVDDYELDHEEIGSNVVRLSYQTEPLRDGRYVLCVGVSDCGLHPNFSEAEVTFMVESKLEIRNVRNFPNPYSRETSFAFSLSRDADLVTIKVYSVAGGLIRTILCAPGLRNSNIVCWDGRDENGNMVTSGVYFYKVTAGEGRERAEGTGKMVVIR